MARIAKSLAVLQGQLNTVAPKRKKPDGWIGDDKHRARKSEHNPDPNGIVRALDVTHDPADGLDCGSVMEQIRRSKDRRVLYGIWNKRIFSPPSWAWRPYDGKNPHDLHFHLSVNKPHADDTGLWAVGTGVLTPAPMPVPSNPVLNRPMLKRGTTLSDDVKQVQRLLKIGVDGKFGVATEAAVRSFQAKHKLLVDGKVGAYTWKALLGK